MIKGRRFDAWLLKAVITLILACLANLGHSATQWSAQTHVLSAGDFNGDGRDDLLVIAKDPDDPSGIALSSASGQPSVFHQSWSGSYLGITWHSETYLPHIGDFNLDGRDDLFLQRRSGGNHYVLLTTSDAEFASIHQSIGNSYLGISWSQSERRIQIGDYNNDGRSDLFLQSDSLPADNVVALAGSNAQFQSIDHSWPNDYLNPPSSIQWNVPRALEHAGDFNGDGYSDLLVQAKPDWILIPYEDLSIPIPTYRDGSYGIVLSDGTGKAATVSDSWDRNNLGLDWSPQHYLIFVADFNGDGYDDVLLQAKRTGEPSYIVLTDTNGQITETTSTVYTLSAGYLGSNWDAASYEFKVGDYDGNGRADIYMQARSPSGTNSVAYPDSGGNITSTPSVHEPSGNFKKPVPGAIPASFRVGSQGEGSYTIPIDAPAGAGGLRPQLALAYNHLRGDGLAGMRWTLSGISAITRCQQTFGQDGSVAAVTYTNTDRFCLDGQRLVSINGAHGASGTEYRTEIETFQRIVQSGTQGGGPQSFRVDHGNGLSSYYGASTDSRVEVTGGSGAVRIWYLSFTEDQFGNRIIYSYSENTATGETVPSEVRWTENAGQGLTAKYKVAITYEARPTDDQRNGYDSAGTQWASTKRIEKIDVLFDGAQLIKSYELTYASPMAGGTGRSQLTEVAVCGATECLPPTVFALQSGIRGWDSLTNTSRTAGTYSFVGDMNGDGKKDIFFVGSLNTWRVYFGNTSGSLDPAIDSGVSVGPNPATARVVDYNSDGRSDLLYKSSSGAWHVIRHNGTTFIDSSTTIPTSTPSHANIRDFDGDGLRDWIYRDGFYVKWRRNLGTSFGAAQTLVGIDGYSLIYEHPDRGPDFNGDGRDDLINLGDYCEPWPEPPYEVCTSMWTILVASGTTYAIEHQLSDLYGGGVGNVKPIDINGDGLHDLVYKQGSSWYTKLSTGSGFSAAIATGIPWVSGQGSIVSDYDNDGREDLILSDGNYWRIYRSNGSTLPASYSDSLYSPGASTASAKFAADLSGDGFEDIVRVYAGTWYTHKHQSALPDVVTAFTDGLGYSIGVQYESLSNSSNYTVDLSQIPPAPYTRYLTSTRYVVASESHDDGVGGTRQFVHKYDTAYVDVSGHRWLAFNFHRVDDVANGTYTRTYFSRTFPFSGMVELEELRRLSDNQLINDVNPVLIKTTWIATAPDRHFVRPESAATREYEVGDATNPMNGAHLRTIVDDPSYSTTYGYVTSTTETITDEVTGDVWTSATDFNRTQYTTPWCLGLPGLVQTTNTLPAPDSTSSVRKIRYTFNSSNCSLSEVKDESEASTAKQLKTTYTYNDYGNVLTVTQDSVDGSAQNRSTTFGYDANQQLPASLTIGTVNLETSFTWDYLVGKRASVTGSDGLTTSWLYDDFGRLTKEIRPGSYTDIAYEDCYGCWPQHARFYAHARGSDGSEGYEFFDELQRTVGSASTLPLGTQGRREIRYNAMGQVAQASQPYVYLDPVFWVTQEYDLLGRLLEEDAPVSESLPSGATTIYDYRGPEISITDAENHATTYVYNGAGQIKQVIDELNATTSYTYQPFGELHTVTDPDSHTTTISYDARGYKDSMSDPNMGAWDYDFNVYGELSSQTNALGQTVTLLYDVAGRLYSRNEVEGLTTLTYYPTGTGKKGRVGTISGPGHSEHYDYSPDHGAPTLIRRTLGGTAYDFNLSYDDAGRLDLLTYPTSTPGYRFTVDYDYDSWGHMTEVKDGDSGQAYYSLSEADALGREVLIALGNGLDEYREFDRATGRLSLIQTGPSLGASVQNLEFSWDEVGNLASRTNHLISKTETFQYDALNRLWTSQVSGQSQIAMAYSGAGRIESKTGVGTYTYADANHPYAVTSAGGVSYGYDANGRVTSRGSSPITWYSYDLPKKITNGTQSAEFSYGVNRDRYKQVTRTGSTVDATIYYVGDLFEKEVAGSSTTYRHHVRGRERTVALVTQTHTGQTVQYLHRDHQDSVVGVTSSSGATAQSLAYDPWGLRRNSLDWSPLGSPFGGTQQFERGYTGHEHLDSVGLIHMNGRIQDPRIGRFISPDPIVQAPYSSQSLNRYSYVWNNPSSHIDPSGFQTLDDPGIPQIPPSPIGLPELPDYALGSDPVLDARYMIDQSLLDEVLCSSGNYEACASPQPQQASPTGSTIDVLGQGFLNALPGYYYSTQSQLAWKQGRYGMSALLYGGAFVDAAIGVVTFGQGSLATNGIRSGSRLIGAGGGWAAVAERPGGAVAARGAAALRYGPINPGPLPAAIANTFRGGRYTATTLSEATTLYRAYGGTAGQIGQFWTRTPPAGSLQASIDLALNPQWGNTAAQVARIRVPAGTTIYEGAAASQGGLVGGGSQVVIPTVNPAWIIP